MAKNEQQQKPTKAVWCVIQRETKGQCMQRDARPRGLCALSLKSPSASFWAASHIPVVALFAGLEAPRETWDGASFYIHSSISS